MRSEETNFLIRDHAVTLIEQLIAYGIPVPVAIQEGWKVVYDLIKQSSDGETPFKNLADARAVLNWSITQLNKDLGLDLQTSPQYWTTRKP